MNLLCFARRSISIGVLLASPLSQAQTPPHTVLIDGALLVRVKADGDATVLRAVRAEADKAMKQAPTSVMDKPTTPPSGDKHDYMSMAPYWWPNPATPSHLPYIRKDGQHNPEAAEVKDHEALARMCKNVPALALAYFLTGEEAYAKRASLLLHVWFLDPATRMNPNLRFAQAILGVNEGRGAGLIDARGLAEVVDGLAMLAGSSNWSAADDAALHGWFDKYLTWLTTSDSGRQEASTKNNHGNWFDVQAGAIACYLGRTDFVRELAETAKTRRIGSQIEPDGEEPLEEARTQSFHYSVFSLEALMKLAAISQTVGVDLWDFKSPRGGAIRGALDYLIPFAERQKPWPHETITGFGPDALRQPLLLAAIAYRDPKYEAAAQSVKGVDDALDKLLELEFADLQRAGDKTR